MLGELPTDRLILYSASGLITALCGLLIRALQTQQRAMGRTLEDQRKSAEATIAQWQAIAVHANTTSVALSTQHDVRIKEMEDKYEARIQTLELTINNLESELDLAHRQAWQYRSDTVLARPAPPAWVTDPPNPQPPSQPPRPFPHMPQYPPSTD